MESPEYLQMSLAAALTLKFMKGSFYRNAKLYCINLLLTYENGCKASCAYCGLNKKRENVSSHAEKSFIRVDWPTYSLDNIISALNSDVASHVERVCVSMITNARSKDDTLTVVKRIHENTDKLIAGLIAPTLVNEAWLLQLKEAGADKVGVAIDTANPELFEKYRGSGVKGPHKWDKYWDILLKSRKIFGAENVSVHLVTGLDESEEDMVKIFQTLQDLGVQVHLFSFFPEPSSALEDRPQPGIGTYRRIQLTRYLLSKNLTHYEKFRFNDEGMIIDFGLSNDRLNKIIEEGKAFMTSGCSGKTLEVACNRPYANCTPFQAYMGETRNFPFIPNEKDIELIKKQLKNYDPSSYIPTIDKAEVFISEN